MVVPKKIRTRNLKTKKNFCGSKFHLPPPPPTPPITKGDHTHQASH